MKIFDLNFDVEEDPIPDGEEHDLLEGKRSKQRKSIIEIMCAAHSGCRN